MQILDGNFQQKWDLFSNSKNCFCGTDWSTFNLFLNSYQQTKLWSSQLNSISKTDDNIASDFGIYQE